jgi:hypothetical protein
MFKLENRPRSMSTTSREKCVHPGLRPVSVTDAEQLLRSLAPLAEEEDEDEFIRAVLPTPRTPEEAIRCAKLQVNIVMHGFVAKSQSSNIVIVVKKDKIIPKRMF